MLLLYETFKSRKVESEVDWLNRNTLDALSQRDGQQSSISAESSNTEHTWVDQEKPLFLILTEPSFLDNQDSCSLRICFINHNTITLSLCGGGGSPSCTFLKGRKRETNDWLLVHCTDIALSCKCCHARFSSRVVRGCMPQALEEVRRRQAEGCCVLVILQQRLRDTIAELWPREAGSGRVSHARMQVEPTDYTSKVDGPP